MLSRTDQLRFLYIDYLNQQLSKDRNFQHVDIPKYSEGKSQETPTNLAVNCLSFNDETPFLGDRAGTLYSNFTLYKNEKAVNTSIINFQILQSIARATNDELADAVFQIDFLEVPDAQGKARAVVTRLDYVVVTRTDSQLTGYRVPEEGVVPSSLLVYQGSYVFDREVYWTYNADSRDIQFLPSPTDGESPISPRVDPEVTIVYLVKADQRTVDVQQGEDNEVLIPHVRITIGQISAGDVYNVRRSRIKNRAYEVYQGMGNYVMTLTGAMVTKPDAEKMMNFLLGHLRQLRPRLAHYGISMTDIAGSLQTDLEEVDVSGDMSKGFEITWTAKAQYQFLWPVPVQLFEVLNFVFESELDPGYVPTPQPLEYLQFTEKFE